MKPEKAKARFSLGRMFDVALAPVFPGWAARRAKARLRFGADNARATFLSAFTRRLGAYDAGDKGRTTADWPRKKLSADQAILGDQGVLVARARSAVRNDWAIASVVRAYKRHVVGTGITAHAAAAHPDTGDPLDEFNRRADKLWNRWARDPALVDEEGDSDFLGIQQLLATEYKQAGESFAVMSYVPRLDQVGLTLQVFEVEQLDTSKSTNADTGYEVRNGIEVTPTGRKVAYWVHLGKHPLESYSGNPSRVPADRVVHLKRKDRPRQTHGVTDLSPVLRAAWHTEMLADYTILRARLESCIGASLETEAGAEIGDMAGLLTGATADQADANSNSQYNFEPGMIWPMPNGVKANFHVPTTPGGTYEPFTKWQVKKIAAGSGMDYPTVSRDFSGNTYAGQRQGLIELWGETDPEQLRMINVALRRIRDQFIAYAVMEGRLEAVMWHVSAEWREAYCEADWQPQAKPWIDPKNQAEARKIMLDYFLTTHDQIFNELGVASSREMFRKIAAERADLASRGLVLPDGGAGAPAAESAPPPGLASFEKPGGIHAPN